MTSTGRIWRGIALPLAFAVLAGAGFCSWVLIPWLEYRRSADWVEVPCVVERFERRRARDNVMWTFDLSYVYEYGAMPHGGTRYSFWNEIVSGSPAGLPRIDPGPATCFVNPRDPRSAVLSRTLGPGFFELARAIGLACGLAIVMSGCVIIHVIVRTRRGLRTK
jgi:hypothetical protein